MLKFWGINRKPAAAGAQTSAVGWAARRRLNFESMEGRLMLSGDAPDFLIWDAYSPESGLALYPHGEMALRTIPVDYVDGGFIQPGIVLSGYSVDGRFDSVTNCSHRGSASNSFLSRQATLCVMS